MQNSRTWILVRQVGVTLENLDGSVRSLNPASLSAPYGPYHWEIRQHGANGGYEQCAVNGGTIVYNPTGHEAVVFGFMASVPHSDGLSAITETPL